MATGRPGYVVAKWLRLFITCVLKFQVRGPIIYFMVSFTVMMTGR